ncbi:MAG: M3 family metallopeptidase [Bacteroidaceae bacterium]|nr:M3 family metallopeptidase [Bacteroidaceae bacterium]
MKKEFIMCAMALSMVACGSDVKEHLNPFFQDSYGTINEVPPFEQITMNDYKEAMLKGIEEQKAEIQAIITNTEAPTFENTIVAMDQCGKLLNKVQSVFFSLSESDSNEEYQALQVELMPLLTELSNDISLNEDLFARVKAVYEQKETLGLDKEQMKLLENTYKSFVRNGANLSEADKATLREINSKLSELTLKFDQNLLHETNNTYVTVDKVEDLEGLPEANIQRAADLAKSIGQEGKYTFNMQRPSCNPVLQYCKNRDLRKQVYEAYYNRGNQNNEWNNKDVAKQVFQLRLKKAKLMGYNSSADMILDNNRMAKVPSKVYDLLMSIWTPAVKKAQEEIADIKEEIKKDGFDFEPEGWDYMYYSSRAKQAKYDIDEELVSEYFETSNVQKGAFYVANKLYGLTFEERTKDYPMYNSSTTAWDVKDKDGKLIAIFYSDYFPRDGKGAGAWCGGFRNQSYENGQRVIPIVNNVCNFTAPSKDKPGLQNIDNVETLFHEFGHALNSFFGDVHYEGVGGNELEFVELPSQINEHWAFEPEVLKVYAKHYKTGEIIPQELLDKIDQSSKYGQGFATTELMAASLVDMDLHCLTDIPDDFDVMKYEEQKLAERGIPRQILPRYRVTNFSHIMGGYNAGYYGYTWSEVLDCDAFQAFKESGDIFNQELAEKFRKYCLAPGGIDDGMTMYVNFRGKEPSSDALLEKRGLK